MQNRRDFIKTLTVAGGALIFKTPNSSSSITQTNCFGLNPLIESNPDAVFILRTNVDSKTNSAAIKEVGRQLGSSLFHPMTDAGMPATTNVVIKPNMTWWSWDIAPIEPVMGIQTDPNFVEGIIGRLNELSVQSSNIFICEANYLGPDSASGSLYAEMANRTNINLKNVSAGVGAISESDVQWIDLQDGIWFKRIPYIWPVKSPNSCLINIAKFKSHSMGMTLCSKNIQGAIARPYVAHCTGWNIGMSGVDPQHVVPDAFANINDNYIRHRDSGIPRWDIPGGSSGGLWMETWASRCLDNNSALKPIINIIEGIYGREGPFVSGPDNGYGRDILTNNIIFGKNSFHVDIVGTYLAGHEPGNFGLFHMAKEHQLSQYLDPRDVPLFEWNIDGTASQSTLADFPRTAIRTLYLQKAGEEQYHMVNESYDYTGDNSETKPDQPDTFVIYQNFPNPFNPTTSIRYYVPSSGNVLIEVFDGKGSRLAILVDARVDPGDHLVVWNSRNIASGTYFYRMSYQGAAITKKMILVR